MGENNDCAVIAAANVLDVPYAQAHDLFKRHGRRDRKGTKRKVSLAALRDASNLEIVYDDALLSLQKLFVRPMKLPKAKTLKQMLQTLPNQGRYWIAAGHHAVAYIDGKLYDNLVFSKLKARVTKVYKITLKSPLSQSQINELWARLDKLERKTP